MYRSMESVALRISMEIMLKHGLEQETLSYPDQEARRQLELCGRGLHAP